MRLKYELGIDHGHSTWKGQNMDYEEVVGAKWIIHKE